MKFKANSRRRALEYEADWVQRWKQNQTFKQSVEQRSKDNSYVFYDGPPFISGVPHHGTLLSSIVKDAVPRYQTMKGKRVERVWGWDAHGLPAERYTEKKLGIHSRQEVIDYGIEKYIIATRENMLETSSAWENIVDRVGRWVDFKGAYKTMDKDYMESVWWAFKTLYEKGKIYEGEKVLMYCTLDGTPLSKAEVTMDAGAYQDVTDPSVYVKFKLKNFEHSDGAVVPTYMLAWTTTPWTLPANTALAVSYNEDQYNEQQLDYAVVELNNNPGERYIVAEALIPTLFEKIKEPIEYRIKELIYSHNGVREKLIGQEYEPLLGADHGDRAYKVWGASYVDAESGTGIVHLAPAYGEEDFELAHKEKIPVIHVIDQNGFYTESDWKGQNVWEANKQIAKELLERGVVWKIDYYRHSYPHCHRCGTRLMYRAHPSWFMDIDDQRTQMLEKNEPINWFPTHVKHGRFEKTIQQAPDWNISRDRFWATAMPVWKSETGKVKVVGSYAELQELAGITLDDYHRPWVDDITFAIDGETYTRIDKVMDSWFEAGSMPFAQFHYPFENKETFEANFPGDFIVEYIGQVRAWFYYMHAMSVALFGENSFKNVIVTGNVAGNDGRKMSKSYGNYTDPNELMDKFSADSLRFLLLSSPLLNGEDFVLQDKEVGDVARKLGMIWNMYDFFTMYAEVDGWEYDGTLKNPIDDCTNPLDTWIISRLQQVVADVETHMDAYNIPDALSPILPFLDDASNWYVRRSRRRFWKSEEDGDKQMAYRTLHYVLVRLAYVLAPFTPFLAEELYHNLTGDNESIHVKDWLPAGHVDQLLVDKMDVLRTCVEDGLRQRAQKGIKIRQPLAKATVEGYTGSLDAGLREIIADELNVKNVDQNQPGTNDAKVTKYGVTIDWNITRELKREGLAREVIRHIQAARKAAGLNIDDRITGELATDGESELYVATNEHMTAISNEVLSSAQLILSSVIPANTATGHIVEIDGFSLRILIEKA